MTITPEELSTVAALAKLDISAEELPNYMDQINGVLSLIQNMQAVNTDDIEPLSHPLELQQRLREDVVSETNQRDALQAIAPETATGLYLVPKVIE